MTAFRTTPHLRQAEPASSRCWDMLIPLVPLAVYSCVYYGWRPLFVMLVSMAAAMAFEVLGYALQMKRAPLADGTAAVTGGVIGLVMSPIVPYWLPIVACGVAVLVAKLPFGGRGRNLFNPAATGLAFVTVCFPAPMFTYPDPERSIADLSQVFSQASPAALMQAGATPNISPMDVMLSNFPGPIGSVMIILIGCMLYLFVRRVSSPCIALPFLGTCALAAVLFPRVSNGAGSSVLLELCAGYLMIAAVFLISDPVTAPRHWLARIVYGVLAGVLVMVLRHVGKFEEGACFAVLLCNLFSNILDRNCWKLCYYLPRLRQRKTTVTGGDADE